MITLKQIAQVFIHDMSGGIPNRDSPLDVRDVVLKARHYLNSTLKPIFWEKKNEGDNSAISQMIYPYELQLQEEAGTKQKYITIPHGYVALIHNRGIHRLFVKGNPYRDFVMQHNPGISSSLPHMQLKNIQYFYVEGSQIRFGKGCTAKKADTLILQILNAAPDSVGENDPLPIPPEVLADLNRLLKADFAPFAQIPATMSNDQNPNSK